MKNKFIIPVLFLALVAAGGWGYSQYQAKRQWEINAENQYQRAFEELTAHVSNMETEMSKGLVAGSFVQSLRSLTNIWREANSSQENLGQLPLTSVELSRTKAVLAKAGAFSFDTAQNRLTQGTALNDEQWKILKQLRDQTRTVSRHLLQLRDQFYTNRAQWLEVDRMGTLGAAGIPSATMNNNKVTKAFIMLEDGLRRSPDIQLQGNNLDFTPKPTGLTGANISSRDAVVTTRRVLGPQWNNATVRYERIIKGNFPSYMISATDRRNPNRNCRVSLSVKGGHLAWLLSNRAVNASRLSLEHCAAQAAQFLARNGYPGMEKVSQQSNGNIALLTMVPLRHQVLYYPEMVKVQVARDNGEILGVDAVAYLTFYEPEAAQPVLLQKTELQIRDFISPHLQLERIRRAQVLDEQFNKVFCYEVAGRQENDRYLLYYNAQTGKEEKIRRVDRNGNELM
ncbi:germination protein YpeB [Hydrogenispora ethanolica]|uniref:Germination protein YpeB n=1 Tax=Hydrogenispora ethanolica TaxID=1082276 RepID=A0A4V2QGM1_HYDET|nr:germination protein YpeB [Hydrogenispora ethanolica]TCL76367.1 germination protein YpeB [Hydrogenispora ethanolica]